MNETPENDGSEMTEKTDGDVMIPNHLFAQLGEDTDESRSLINFASVEVDGHVATVAILLLNPRAVRDWMETIRIAKQGAGTPVERSFVAVVDAAYATLFEHAPPSMLPSGRFVQ